jgi:hypothetical protein
MHLWIDGGPHAIGGKFKHGHCSNAAIARRQELNELARASLRLIDDADSAP